MSPDAGTTDRIAVIDFGGQYSQLIARRIREADIHSLLLPHDTPVDELKDLEPKGVILSGGPASVYGEGAPTVDEGLFSLDVPVLGICYGMQLMSHLLPGGDVEKADKCEYGRATVTLDTGTALFRGVTGQTECWMSHGDRVESVPDEFVVAGETENAPVAAMADERRFLYGVQFHPEVTHTEQGQRILENFAYRICGCTGNWTSKQYVTEQIEKIRKAVGENQVICGLSGGVDSSVAAAIVHEAVGNQLTCILVDHGLLRHGEVDEVRHTFEDTFGMDLRVVDARDQFFNRLQGVTDPEEKRSIIGEAFIDVFEEEAERIDGAAYLVQGTIYSDVIESGGATNASTIKSHHNVGGLPEQMGLDLIEPLRSLFKDEVREVGEELGLPEELVWRQPFPGPGLGIRVLGEVTPEKAGILRQADAIIREVIADAGLQREVWQYFATLPNMQSVGVQGDERTYSYTVGVRAVTSEDAMTADWARLPHDVLDTISTRITNEVPDVNRVVYDITSKPPATIEWE